MTQGRFEAHPGAPVFFLSYARAKHRLPEPARDVNQKALQLYNDLSDHVYELLGLPAGNDAGFIDRVLDGGQRWTADLAFAVGHCQVFIALLSTPYVNSEWCAREWHAFARRPSTAHPGVTATAGDTSLIPVNWSVTAPAELPKTVRERQLFAPAGLPPHIAPLYHNEGIYGLFSLGAAGREAYDAVVWRLAQRVARAFRTQYVHPRAAPDFTGLHTRFEEDTA